MASNSVDVISSKVALNLAADKDRALAEALRVLEPGGRFAACDVIVRGEVPPAIRRNMEPWTGCVAGALSGRNYLDRLERTGFTDAGLEITRVHGVDDARDFHPAQGADLPQPAAQVDGRIASGFIRATTPAGAPATSV